MKKLLLWLTPAAVLLNIANIALEEGLTAWAVLAGTICGVSMIAMGVGLSLAMFWLIDAGGAGKIWRWIKDNWPLLIGSIPVTAGAALIHLGYALPGALLMLGAVAVEVLHRGQPLLRAQVASGADAEGLSRLAVALTEPDRVIFPVPVDQDELPALVPGDVVAFPWPSYSLYPVLARMQEARPVAVEFPEDYALPPALAETGARLTLVSNPNSPSGTMVPPERLGRLAERPAEGLGEMPFAEPIAGSRDCFPERGQGLVLTEVAVGRVGDDGPHGRLIDRERLGLSLRLLAPAAHALHVGEATPDAPADVPVIAVTGTSYAEEALHRTAPYFTITQASGFSSGTIVELLNAVLQFLQPNYALEESRAKV